MVGMANLSGAFRQRGLIATERSSVEVTKGPSSMEGRLDVSSNHPDGVESEYAILKPSCGGEISGTTLDDRLKPNTAWPHIYTTASPSTPNKTHFRGFDL
ncbi:TPA: hypothetical protein ACH3X2_011618 [Trebouxia sp. C0005]